ncbi:MAG TPA: glycoside hydrolase family 16 protein [Polyangiaceae bacterium]|nr:glycoside hydrolase family 16 protein [Polyangiaceae bacterium]
MGRGCVGLVLLATLACGDQSGGGSPAADGADAAGGATGDATSHDSVRGDGADTDSTAVDAAADLDSATLDSPADGALAGWTLTWADEFDGPDGSAVDPSRWSHDVGGNGWGNNELEYYTDGTQNAVVEGGNLVITATTAGASAYTCSFPTNGPCRYTSARLLTQGKFSQQYGRFEARIQIPEGQGLWPAFWMLGANIATVSWPACGEIDIMENIGKEPSVNHGSLHAPGFPGSGLTGSYTLPGGAKLGDAFHTYAVEWEPSAIRFYVDDQLYETQTPSNTPAGGTWEFGGHPFFLLLNVAVGGAFPGAPDSTTVFPQTMKVDWVRVYARTSGEP